MSSLVLFRAQDEIVQGSEYWFFKVLGPKKKKSLLNSDLSHTKILTLAGIKILSYFRGASEILFTLYVHFSNERSKSIARVISITDGKFISDSDLRVT